MHKPGTLVKLNLSAAHGLRTSVKEACTGKLGEILYCDEKTSHNDVNCICTVWFPELNANHAIFFARLHVLSVPADAPLAEPVWEKWLPPCALPDTGPKVFKAGQVWAWSTGNTSGVFRVTVNGSSQQSRLAGGDVSNSYPRPVYIDQQDTCGCHAILICEPGCTPIPPEILFGK